jgi:iron uptake system EfeUOB component EfeO/EfeM
MKAMKFMVPVMILAMIALVGCGSKTSKSTDGVKNMKTVITELKTNIAADDSAKVKQDAADLETNWATFEDGVKADNPEAYAKIEDPLHIIQAGAEVSPLDKAILTKAADDLNTALDLVK